MPRATLRCQHAKSKASSFACLRSVKVVKLVHRSRDGQKDKMDILEFLNFGKIRSIVGASSKSSRPSLYIRCDRMDIAT